MELEAIFKKSQCFLIHSFCIWNFLIYHPLLSKIHFYDKKKTAHPFTNHAFLYWVFLFILLLGPLGDVSVASKSITWDQEGVCITLVERAFDYSNILRCRSLEFKRNLFYLHCAWAMRQLASILLTRENGTKQEQKHLHFALKILRITKANKNFLLPSEG